jgi:hypothetical protein
MDKASLEREVQELRKQAELLTDRERSRNEVEEPPEDDGSSDEELNLSTLRTKIEEFMGMLQKDLREVPATTAVAIFALGVLMGRLLPR